MQIWVIGRGIPSKENNMLGSFEFEQAKMLAQRGYEVYYPIIDLRSIRHRRKMGLACENVEGVHVVALNVPIGCALPAIIRNRLYAPLHKLQLKALCQRYGVPNIVNVHYLSLYQYDIYGYLQAQGAKIIGTEHWSKVQNCDLSEGNRRNLERFVEKADAIICVGNELKKAIVQLTKTTRDIQIIPNTVLPIFTYEKPSSESQIFRFLAVGRLSKEKGYDRLIQAFCQSFENRQDVHLDIVGGGPEYKTLQEIVLRNHADDRITLHGVMQRNELSQFYHKCNALVMPSDYETFGVPVIEAMACGLPVIVTQRAGVSHYIDHEKGNVIKDNEVGNISEALVDIYNRYSEFDRQQISEFSKHYFSEDTVFELLKEIFKRVTEGEVI